MHRNDHSSAVAELPAPQAAGTPGFFTRGNPITATPATTPTADWCNSIQEEIAAVIEDAGIALSKTTRNQLLSAINAKIAIAFAGSVITVTGAGALTAAQAGVVLVNVTTDAALTLPLANANGGKPYQFRFYRTDVSAAVVTITRAGTNTIGGVSSIVLPIGASVLLESDGASAWRIAGRRGYGETVGYTGISGNTTLTPAQTGQTILCSPAAAAAVTLPLVAQMPPGGTLRLVNTSAYVVTIGCQGSNVLVTGGPAGSAAVSSIALRPGESLDLVSGATSWYAVGGSAQLANAFAFKSTIGTTIGDTLFQRQPSGLLIQAGRVILPNSGDLTSTVNVTFPEAFTSAALSIVATAGGDANSTAGFAPSCKVTNITNTGCSITGDMMLAGGGTSRFNQTVPVYWQAMGK